MSKKLLNGTELAISCPECVPVVKMRVRTNRENGSQFLGCPNYPDCTETKPIPEDVKMRLKGAASLPGFFDE
jgi:ssDNA-binding Zn-finger/Zn-ribbon topoisomerase 1